MKRRTVARLELLLSLATLGYSAWLRRFLRRHGEDVEPLSPLGLVAGAVTAAVHRALYDRDVGRIRTRRRRGLLFGLCSVGWQRLLRRASSDPDAFRYGYGLGRGVGTLLYRTWFGLLRDLPGDDE
ncbi:hypothetical protein NDI76_00260 [Halogeometricum sp. S1BR25-6]|uniref:DUF8097 domain-containing protein n=1 Tax=Halogeometricum salsisoli TaxID=2950536 RepID=A0ABU2G8R2_9EURY|nr:hypothetical protein [Halogeometricum sp. S1BR25-6]MDS0297172.1 hypothetical protein [Halogeometricum sp. S1BR25-6]